jgi:hypothetical protein
MSGEEEGRKKSSQSFVSFSDDPGKILSLILGKRLLKVSVNSITL